jgi:hypothetical protein
LFQCPLWVKSGPSPGAFPWRSLGPITGVAQSSGPTRSRPVRHVVSSTGFAGTRLAARSKSGAFESPPGRVIQPTLQAAGHPGRRIWTEARKRGLQKGAYCKAKKKGKWMVEAPPGLSGTKRALLQCPNLCGDDRSEPIVRRDAAGVSDALDDVAAVASPPVSPYTFDTVGHFRTLTSCGIWDQGGEF